jgi:hypothetical protein
MTAACGCAPTAGTSTGPRSASTPRPTWITAVVRGRRVPVLRLDVTPRRESPMAGQRIVLGGRAALIGDRIVSWAQV